MRKRGMISPVFKYIMALLVGVLFLLFLINFAFTYSKQRSSIDAYRLMTGFDDVLSALGSSEDSDNTYNFGVKTDLHFKKGTDKIKDTFFLESLRKKKKTYKIIFSPEDMSGTGLHLLTKRWYFPYAIDNFFYMTNSNYKYFLVPIDDDYVELVNELAGPEEEVTAEIPPKFGVEVLEEEKINDPNTLSIIKKSVAGFKKTTFILFGENRILEGKLEEIPKSQIRIIYLDENNPGFGEVVFEDDQRYPFFGKPMMIGAFFVEDSDTYDFALAKALQKVSVVTNIYKDKLQLIAGKPQFFHCQLYSLMQNNLNTISELARSDSREINDYIQYTKALEDNNLQLGGDCPEIF